MTQGEMLTALQNGYSDDLGLVKPHKTDGESDNGVLFTTIAQILSDSNFMETVVQSCYLEPGLLARKPRGINSQQEQFDDVLSRFIRCIQSGNTKEPREILWYGLRHGGFYNTDNQLEGKDFLFRFFFVFVFGFAAAFPFLKGGLVKLILSKYVDSFNPNSMNDTSALQLQWIQTLGHEYLYGKGAETEWYRKFNAATGKKLSDFFAVYYEEFHPITLYVETNFDD